MRALYKKNAPLIGLLVVLVTFCGPGRSLAQGIEFIRDAEIENTIRVYSTPVFQAAGLSPSAIRIFLVKDKSLNAFVAGGQNMFLHTGLLVAAKSPLEVIGVIAHEAGHIAGGHIVSRRDAFEGAGTTAIATTLLGIGAAILTGEPGLGAVVIAGGQDIALKGLLSHTRSQESSADQAAITYLNATMTSPKGLVDFTRRLQGQEVLLSNNQDPYLRTHPLTEDRLDFFQQSLKNSPYRDQPATPELDMLQARMVAKLVGFLDHPRRVLQLYPESDQSLPARYARAIAAQRDNRLEESIALIDGLLREQPDDPFFHELRGQMLFEYGRLADALPDYEKAATLLPDSPTLRLSLAQVQIESNQPGQDEAALANLEYILRKEPGNGFAWRLAATAHGRRGEEGLAALALGEAAQAGGRPREAEALGLRAQKLLPENTPAWLRAQDLTAEAARKREKNK